MHPTTGFRHRLSHRSGHQLRHRLQLAAILLVWVLSSLLTQGVMPATTQSGVTLVLCSADGVVTMPMPDRGPDQAPDQAQAQRDRDAPGDPSGTRHPCIFAAAPSLVALVATDPLLPRPVPKVVQRLWPDAAPALSGLRPVPARARGPPARLV